MSIQELRDVEDYCRRLGITPCDICRKDNAKPECKVCGWNPGFHIMFELDPIIEKVRTDGKTV